MNKYFELRENNEVLFGVIENIPEKVTLEEIKSRIESNSDSKSITIVDKEFTNIDIIMDWLSIDYEQGLDEEYMHISENLDIAIDYGIESDIVYSALKYLKNNPDVSITDAIDYAMKTQKK